MDKPMRQQVRFLLGQELRELDRVDPTMTVLDWLRLVERRTGTKEGCNEGDCGACTVAIGRLVDGRIRYRAVNACIRFVGQLDGCQLLTVEDLAQPDGAPHPVQRAMVECHGAQCGFCTPGFVMSLFGLYENAAKPEHSDTALSPQKVDDALAGNLCRCTGYASIAAAAHRMLQLSRGEPDRLTAGRPDTVARLEALAAEAAVTIGDAGRWFHAPASVDTLADLLLEHPDARIVAGATDVGLWVTKDLRLLERVIDIGRVRELQRIDDIGDALAIGAGVTYADAMPILAKLYPDLGEVFRRLGGEQVRNVGTIGGNIANGSPIGDSPPMLIALGARLVLRRGEQRREIPLEDFFIDYGRQDRRPSEFVETIVLPKPGPGLRFRAYKVSKRFDQDISAVLGAFALTIEDGKVGSARIAYGGMAATPRRAFKAEAALIGRPWTEPTIETAMAAIAEDFTPITDWRASAGYRARVAANLLRRLLVETTDAATETRLVGDRSLAHV
jgi:xanthine dehydrogenase small subunit